MPRSVLITGITGCVGTALARRLIDLGVSVFGVVRAHASQPLPEPTQTKLFPCATFDCAELEAIIRAARPDAVVHLAAAGVSAEVERADVMRANVDLTLNLVTAASLNKIPVIHTGSCFEYADAGIKKLDETALVAPFNWYGATKAASVQLAIGLSRELNSQLVVLRLFGVYGPGESERRFVPYLIRSLQRGKTVALTSGLQQRDLTYVGDIAEAYVHALSHWDRLENHTIYNVCSERSTTIRLVGVQVAQQLQRPQEMLRWGALPGRPGEPAHIVGNCARFRHATGWVAQHDLETGLQKTIEAYISDPKRASQAA
ncbi:MAG: NAD-dependent epimerase/dehydratase family protein [Pirellulaceae bacterium]